MLGSIAGNFPSSASELVLTLHREVYIMKLPKFIPGLPITAHDGLLEAILDILTEDYGYDIFHSKELQKRLPYGARVRHILCEGVNNGWLERVAYGYYRVIR